MEPTKLHTLAEWAGGKLSGNGDAAVTSICTDSRRLQPGDLFLALRGENFDGHAFAAQAAKLGAAGLVVEKAPSDLPPGFPVIEVADTLSALQKIAAAYRRSLSLRVIGITGSNGKTSTKDFTAAVLAEKFSVLKTEGNLNNHIGLPITLLCASAQHEVAVIEMGMNHPGEIAPLAAIAAPEIGIITNVGSAHIEFMGTREAIALEKGRLAEAIGARGVVILDAENDFTPSIAARTKARVLRVGLESGDLRAKDIHAMEGGMAFIVSTSMDRALVTLPVPGWHMVSNALFAIAAGMELGLTLAECARGLAKAELTKGRLERKSAGGVDFLDDSYNANPDSMGAALQTLRQLPAAGRRFAVLGKMNELGAESERGHRAVGTAAAAAGIDLLITVGPVASLIADAARLGGLREVFAVASIEQAITMLRDLAQPGDLVLIKGSRGARMERIFEGVSLPREEAAA